MHSGTLYSFWFFLLFFFSVVTKLIGFSYHLDFFLFKYVVFILKNTQIEGNVFLHELCFPTVPNDPLVPTAVLGEDRSPSLSIPA